MHTLIQTNGWRPFCEDSSFDVRYLKDWTRGLLPLNGQSCLNLIGSHFIMHTNEQDDYSHPQTRTHTHGALQN